MCDNETLCKKIDEYAKKSKETNKKITIRIKNGKKEIAKIRVNFISKYSKNNNYHGDRPCYIRMINTKTDFKMSEKPRDIHEKCKYASLIIVY